MELSLGLGLGLTSVLSAFGAGMVLAGLRSRREPEGTSLFREQSDGIVFLFDAEVLLDATPAARALLAGVAAIPSPWGRLIACLTPSFANVAQHLSQLRDTGLVLLEGEDSEGMPLFLRAEWRGGLTRIILTGPETPGQMSPADALHHRAMTAELSVLRGMLAEAPLLAWREGPGGDVTWANTAYVLAAGASLDPGQDLSWPLPRLFDRIATAQGAAGQRQKISRRDGPDQWFDLTVRPESEGRKVFALPCDAAVNAEGTLRDMMQTLTRTFAFLPIGIAVFDRQRRLQLFNPALVDLTGLPPDFLSARPTVLAMLDMMRDRNMVPEPKDYRRWRDQFAAMEGSDGVTRYEETWNLAGGQTYKVMGRPHPTGAMALMFEDISGEMLRTRRFHANLELSQAVIDAMEEAVAVFSSTGQLVMLNDAYVRLWNHDPSERFTDAGIHDAAQHWARLTAPGTLWSEAEDFVATVGDRLAWRTEARLADGRLLACRLQPLAGGATLIGFLATGPLPAPAPAPEIARRQRRRA